VFASRTARNKEFSEIKMPQTRTYIGILPELGRGEGLAIYQIVGLCGTAEELTTTMEHEMWLFGRTFQKVEDPVFQHNPASAMFEEWYKRARRLTPDTYPTIIKTTSPSDFPIVSQRLKEQWAISGLELVEGDSALTELRKSVAILEEQDSYLFQVRVTYR